MINTQNIAELSEKVAALEAAIKTAGIELPKVTTDDNGKTLQVVAGKWDKGAIIPDAVTANPTGEITNNITALQIGSTKYNIEDSSTYAVLNGTMDANVGFNVDVEMPAGFTIANTIIVGFQVNTDTNVWRSGEGIASTSLVRMFAQMSSHDDKHWIKVYNGASEAVNKPYKILLKKIS